MFFLNGTLLRKSIVSYQFSSCPNQAVISAKKPRTLFLHFRYPLKVKTRFGKSMPGSKVNSTKYIFKNSIIEQQLCGFLHCFFDFENRQTETLGSFDQRCQQHDTEIKETVYPKEEERE